MNIRQPLQRQRDKRWDMTACSGSSHAHPIGYCNLDGAQYDPQNHLQYHDTGHNTADEAIACFRRWLADKATQGENPDEQRRCAECGSWTTYRVVADDREFVLCGDHATRENIVKALGKRGAQ